MAIAAACYLCFRVKKKAASCYSIRGARVRIEQRCARCNSSLFAKIPPSALFFQSEQFHQLRRFKQMPCHVPFPLCSHVENVKRVSCRTRV